MPSKHTPGPWKLTAGRTFETTSGKFSLTYKSDPQTSTPEFRNFSELDANARLIAMAPDMLETLQTILTRFDLEECTAMREDIRNLIERAS